MNTQPAIKLTNVSKVFYSYAKPRYRLQEMMRPILGKLHPRFDRNYADEFWALKDISFEIPKGSAFGIIGRNGAGKSTLLQIIAGTLTPTAGEVEVNGRVNALLELGSGFNPEFTGRENVYMNGSILGFTKEQIDDKFQEIHDFSEIGEFINQPVKTYSSGMFVRLAFAVQAMLEPDILIVDEALSVGDVFFQQKCFKRIEELRELGTTLLFVSHDLGAVSHYCSQALLLKSGNIEAIGKTIDVVGAYYKKSNESKKVESQEQASSGALKEVENFFQLENDWVVITKDELKKQEDPVIEYCAYRFTHENHSSDLLFPIGKKLELELKIKLRKGIDTPLFGFEIIDRKNIRIFKKYTYQMDNYSMKQPQFYNGYYHMNLQLELGISPENYTFNLSIASTEWKHFENIYSFRNIDFDAVRKYHSTINLFTFRIKERDDGFSLPLYGIVDLPCKLELV